MSRTLYTIGFTRKGAEQFFGLLERAGVQRVLDIRARPDSQLAGFARGRDLAWFLGKVGIAYQHVPSLAPSRTLLAEYRDESVDWPGYTQRYLAGLDEPAVLGQLAGVELDRCCLLCAEPLADQCHRRLAAEWLAARMPDLVIEHLR